MKTVITGMGAVTALGDSVPEMWKNLLEGVSGADMISLFDASGMETRFAAEAKNSFEQKAKEILRKRDSKKMTRVTRMLMVAAEEAIENSGIFRTEQDMTRVSVIIGGVSTSYNENERLPAENIIVKSMLNAFSAWLSIHYGVKGPNFVVSTACASSAYAIALGHMFIHSGLSDVVICGGADSQICEEGITGFNQIMALSTNNDSPKKASRPFSVDRDGFVMGEGAGVLILESFEHACRRDVDIFAELAGFALFSESSDIVAPQDAGAGMEAVMKNAMAAARVKPEDIGYINAHGTSTYLNDKFETEAIKRCFGRYAENVLVSSTKSMIGHTIGAAGAIEGIVTAKSLYSGQITPTINYTRDDSLNLNYVPNAPIDKDIKVALSNSFAFGGHNACLVFRKHNI